MHLVRRESATSCSPPPDGVTGRFESSADFRSVRSRLRSIGSGRKGGAALAKEGEASAAESPQTLAPESLVGSASTREVNPSGPMIEEALPSPFPSLQSSHPSSTSSPSARFLSSAIPDREDIECPSPLRAGTTNAAISPATIRSIHSRVVSPLLRLSSPSSRLWPMSLRFHPQPHRLLSRGLPLCVGAGVNVGEGTLGEDGRSPFQMWQGPKLWQGSPPNQTPPDPHPHLSLNRSLQHQRKPWWQNPDVVINGATLPNVGEVGNRKDDAFLSSVGFICRGTDHEHPPGSPSTLSLRSLKSLRSLRSAAWRKGGEVDAVPAEPVAVSGGTGGASPPFSSVKNRANAFEGDADPLETGGGHDGNGADVLEREKDDRDDNMSVKSLRSRFETPQRRPWNEDGPVVPEEDGALNEDSEVKDRSVQNLRSRFERPAELIANDNNDDDNSAMHTVVSIRSKFEQSRQRQTEGHTEAVVNDFAIINDDNDGDDNSTKFSIENIRSRFEKLQQPRRRGRTTRSFQTQEPVRPHAPLTTSLQRRCALATRGILGEEPLSKEGRVDGACAGADTKVGTEIEEIEGAKARESRRWATIDPASVLALRGWKASFSSAVSPRSPQFAPASAVSLAADTTAQTRRRPCADGEGDADVDVVDGEECGRQGGTSALAANSGSAVTTGLLATLKGARANNDADAAQVPTTATHVSNRIKAFTPASRRWSPRKRSHRKSSISLSIPDAPVSPPAGKGDEGLRVQGEGGVETNKANPKGPGKPMKSLRAGDQRGALTALVLHEEREGPVYPDDTRQQRTAAALLSRTPNKGKDGPDRPQSPLVTAVSHSPKFSPVRNQWSSVATSISYSSKSSPLRKGPRLKHKRADLNLGDLSRLHESYKGSDETLPTSRERLNRSKERSAGGGRPHDVPKEASSLGAGRRGDGETLHEDGIISGPRQTLGEWDDWPLTPGGNISFLEKSRLSFDVLTKEAAARRIPPHADVDQHQRDGATVRRRLSPRASPLLMTSGGDAVVGAAGWHLSGSGSSAIGGRAEEASRGIPGGAGVERGYERQTTDAEITPYVDKPDDLRDRGGNDLLRKSESFKEVPPATRDGQEALDPFPVNRRDQGPENSPLRMLDMPASGLGTKRKENPVPMETMRASLSPSPIFIESNRHVAAQRIADQRSGSSALEQEDKEVELIMESGLADQLLENDLDTDSEFGEGVTLSPSSSTVSALTNPTCLDDSTSEMDQSETDEEQNGSSIGEGKGGRVGAAAENYSYRLSEVSSSQPSESAAPLIQSALIHLNTRLQKRSNDDCFLNDCQASPSQKAFPSLFEKGGTNMESGHNQDLGFQINSITSRGKDDDGFGEPFHTASDDIPQNSATDIEAWGTPSWDFAGTANDRFSDNKHGWLDWNRTSTDNLLPQSSLEGRKKEIPVDYIISSRFHSNKPLSSSNLYTSSSLPKEKVKKFVADSNDLMTDRFSTSLAMPMADNRHTQQHPQNEQEVYSKRATRGSANPEKKLNTRLKQVAEHKNFTAVSKSNDDFHQDSKPFNKNSEEQSQNVISIAASKVAASRNLLEAFNRISHHKPISTSGQTTNMAKRNNERIRYQSWQNSQQMSSSMERALARGNHQRNYRDVAISSLAKDQTNHDGENSSPHGAKTFHQNKRETESTLPIIDPPALKRSLAETKTTPAIVPTDSYGEAITAQPALTSERYYTDHPAAGKVDRRQVDVSSKRPASLPPRKLSPQGSDSSPIYRMARFRRHRDSLLGNKRRDHKRSVKEANLPANKSPISSNVLSKNAAFPQENRSITSPFRSSFHQESGITGEHIHVSSTEESYHAHETSENGAKSDEEDNPPTSTSAHHHIYFDKDFNKNTGETTPKWLSPSSRYRSSVEKGISFHAIKTVQQAELTSPHMEEMKSGEIRSPISPIGPPLIHKQLNQTDVCSTSFPKNTNSSQTVQSDHVKSTSVYSYTNGQRNHLGSHQNIENYAPITRSSPKQLSPPKRFKGPIKSSSPLGVTNSMGRTLPKPASNKGLRSSISPISQPSQMHSNQRDPGPQLSPAKDTAMFMNLPIVFVTDSNTDKDFPALSFRHTQLNTKQHPNQSTANPEPGAKSVQSAPRLRNSLTNGTAINNAKSPEISSSPSDGEGNLISEIDKESFDQNIDLDGRDVSPTKRQGVSPTVGSRLRELKESRRLRAFHSQTGFISPLKMRYSEAAEMHVADVISERSPKVSASERLAKITRRAREEIMNSQEESNKAKTTHIRVSAEGYLGMSSDKEIGKNHTNSPTMKVDERLRGPLKKDGFSNGIKPSAARSSKSEYFDESDFLIPVTQLGPASKADVIGSIASRTAARLQELVSSQTKDFGTRSDVVFSRSVSRHTPKAQISPRKENFRRVNF